MTPTDVYDVAQLAIITLLWVSGPLMLIALGVGLLIALIQALTSIQEITLTFVPKIIIVFASLMFLLPLMADRMSIMAQELFGRIVGG
jgi:flagellar biosynthetic protein FliQ